MVKKREIKAGKKIEQERVLKGRRSFVLGSGVLE